VGALARRWPALAGAALVTALVPVGAALAAGFSEGITAGSSTFTSSRGNHAVRAEGDGSLAAVLAKHPGATAVEAEGGSLGVKATGSVFGVEAKSPGRAGVRAEGNTGVEAAGNGSNGIGVLASGKKAGVKATGFDGAGVEATGTTAGVFGSTSAPFGAGLTGAASGPDGIGVIGNGLSMGVRASASGPDGTGLSASADRGVGGSFSGGKAPVRLVPAATAGPPAAASGAHQAGELYVDSAGQLFICTAAGTPGTWVKVGTQQ
jgi:hypothetical protein